MGKEFNLFYQYFNESKEFDLIQEELSEEFFGNRYAIFSNNKILIRIVLDRSDFRLEISEEAGLEHYFDLELVFSLLLGKEVSIVSNGFNDIIHLFNQNIEEIHFLFDKKNILKTKEQLNELAQKRFDKYFGN